MYTYTRFISIGIAIATMLFGVCLAQPLMKGTPQFNQFRGIGDTRIWELRCFDSTIGTVQSIVASTSESGGFVLQRKLVTDYSSTGGLRTEIDGTHTISSLSEYVGDKLSITMQGRTERLELLREGSAVTGFATRGGERIAQSTDLSATVRYAFDNPDFDLIEMYLASIDLTAGDSLIDTIFVPQLMSTQVIRGKVLRLANFESKVLNRTEAAYHIQIAEPQEQTWYFTTDKRLTYVRWPLRNIEIYQTRVQRTKTETISSPPLASGSPLDLVDSDTASKPPALNRDSLMARVKTAQQERLSKGAELPSLPALAYIALAPHVILYLLIALAWFLVVTRGSIRQSTTWINIAVGVGLGIVALFTQVPIQRWIVTSIVYPAVSQGQGSILLYGFLPALVAGLLQGGLVFFGVGALSGQARGSARQLAVLGGALGVGFGFLEACYMQKSVGITPLISISLIERAFLLAFHVSTAALFGAYLFRNMKSAAIVAVMLVVANALFRYMPVLVQAKVVDLGILYFVLAVISLGIVVWAMLTIRKLPILKARPRRLTDTESQPDNPSETPSE
jgi:hypothetical protein